MNPVLTSWWAPRSCASGRTPGTRRAGGCSADVQCHESWPCSRHHAARAHGEACPCGRGPWRTACSNQSGTNAPAAPCSERWRSRRCRLWGTEESIVVFASGWRIKQQAWIHLLNGAGYTTLRYQSDPEWPQNKPQVFTMSNLSSILCSANAGLIYWPYIHSYRPSDAESLLECQKYFISFLLTLSIGSRNGFKDHFTCALLEERLLHLNQWKSIQAE